jgi:hypothetical protein
VEVCVGKRKRRTARPDEQRDRGHRIDPEVAAQDMDRQGPSPGDPIDEAVIHQRKSRWVEPSAASAGDEVTPDELKAFDLLGRDSVRNDAIDGVSGPEGLPPSPEGETPGGRRRNPPLTDPFNDTIGEGETDG